MKDLKEHMRHFHAWAGIQRTRHEHRCAVTQPNPQAFNTTVPSLFSLVLHIILPSIPVKTHLKYFCSGFFSIYIPGIAGFIL
jgi:hypothetical protein